MGESHETIVDLAEDEGRDLIIMGIKGVHPTERFLMGSTTVRVIGYSEQDVLVVPEKATIGWTRILLATDGSEYSRKAAARAFDLVQFYGGTLKVVSVLEISSHIYAAAPEVAEEKIKLPKKFAAEVKEQAAARGILAEDFVREGESAYQVIIELAREKTLTSLSWDPMVGQG